MSGENTTPRFRTPAELDAYVDRQVTRRLERRDAERRLERLGQLQNANSPTYAQELRAEQEIVAKFQRDRLVSRIQRQGLSESKTQELIAEANRAGSDVWSTHYRMEELLEEHEQQQQAAKRKEEEAKAKPAPKPPSPRPGSVEARIAEYDRLNPLPASRETILAAVDGPPQSPKPASRGLTRADGVAEHSW